MPTPSTLPSPTMPSSCRCTSGSLCRHPAIPSGRQLWRGVLLALVLISTSAQARSPVHAAPPAAIAASASTPITVQDDRGHTLRLERPAQRVISLLPSLTENVCALGACHRLVGIDRYSDWPARQLAHLPRVGGGMDPNIEAIVALRPDVVLVSEASRASDRLTALGITVLALQTQTRADVRRGMERIAAVLGLPAQRVQQHWQRMDAGIAAAAARVPTAARGKRLFVEVSPGPFAAGESSYLGEILTMLGMRNVVTAQQGPFPRLNPEFVVEAAPDALLFTSRAAHTGQLYPGWQHLPAVRAGRICRFSDSDSKVLIHPGPRMDRSAHILARCLAHLWAAQPTTPAARHTPHPRASTPTMSR